MNPTSALKILQITDQHILARPQQTLMGVNTDFYWRAVFDHALQNHPDSALIILTGDLCQQPSVSSYQRILQTLTTTSIPCICLPGNHDDFSLMQQTLNHGNVSCNKQMVFEHWQIINLNSQIIGQTGGYLQQDELDFVEQCVNRHPDLHVLVTCHHHCTATGSRWMDTMQIKNSDALFQKLLNFAQIRAITTGHIHQQLETEKGHIRVFGTPSTCFQFKPYSRDFALDSSAPGYRWFELSADGEILSKVERLPVSMDELDVQSGGY